MSSVAQAAGPGFQVRVITPDKVAYEAQATSVQFPGIDGLYGILKNHAPMITAIASGILVVKEAGGQERAMFLSDGFAEVKDNVLLLVVDSSERPDEVDPARARKAEERARARIAERVKVDIDLPRAEAALQRAMFRQRLVKKYRA